MNKKLRHTYKPVPPRRPLWFPIIAGGAVLLVIAGLAIWWSAARSGPVTQTGRGAPKMAVDRTTIDDGYVKFETPVQAAFIVSNNGNQPLQILSEPQVELVEGC